MNAKTHSGMAAWLERNPAYCSGKFHGFHSGGSFNLASASRRTTLLFWKFHGLYGGGGGSFNYSEKFLAFSASRSSLISYPPRSTLSRRNLGQPL